MLLLFRVASTVSGGLNQHTISKSEEFNFGFKINKSSYC